MQVLHRFIKFYQYYNHTTLQHEYFLFLKDLIRINKRAIKLMGQLTPVSEPDRRNDFKVVKSSALESLDGIWFRTCIIRSSCQQLHSVNKFKYRKNLWHS